MTAVSSALIVTPVAAPGDSPFKSVPGQTFVSGLLVFVVLAACFVVGIPALGVAIAAQPDDGTHESAIDAVDDATRILVSLLSAEDSGSCPTG